MEFYGIYPSKNLVPFTLRSYFEVDPGQTMYGVNSFLLLNSIPPYDYHFVLSHVDGCLDHASV